MTTLKVELEPLLLEKTTPSLLLIIQRVLALPLKNIMAAYALIVRATV